MIQKTKEFKETLASLGFKGNLANKNPEEAKEELFSFLVESDCSKTQRNTLFKLFSNISGLGVRDLNADYKNLEERLIREKREAERAKQTGDVANCLEACRELKDLDRELWTDARQEIWKGMFFADPAFSDVEQELIIEALVDYTGISKSALEKEWNKTKFKFILEEPYNDLTTIIVSSRFLKDLTDEALEVLGQANNPPSLFTRGGLMVRVKKNGDVVVMNRVGLSDLLDRNSSFVKVGKQGNEPVLEPAFVPEKLAANILELTNTDNPPTPQLDTISTVPVFTRNKKLLVIEGYHPEHNTLLRLGGLKNVRADIPMNEARSLVEDELLTDFPFADDSGLAHAYAILSLTFVRPMIYGPTPLHVVEAYEKGTGKGLLCEVAALLATGKSIPVMTLKGTEEELDKRITALLLEGAPLVLFDNVTTLKGETLAALLTSETWRGRRLGKSEMRTLKNNAIWCATGNNVDVVGDIARRVIPIRLDAKVEKPYERTGFKHPNLKKWVLENRVLLVSALLSIIKSYIDSGCSLPTKCRTLGSYEGYREVIGGILEHAGIDHFLDGLEVLHEEGDAEVSEWKAVCKLWWSQHGGLPISSRDFLNICKGSNLLLDLWGGRSDLSAYQRIGHALRKSRNKVIGEYVVRYAGINNYTNSKEYKLEEK